MQLSQHAETEGHPLDTTPFTAHTCSRPLCSKCDKGFFVNKGNQRWISPENYTTGRGKCQGREGTVTSNLFVKDVQMQLWVTAHAE